MPLLVMNLGGAENRFLSPVMVEESLVDEAWGTSGQSSGKSGNRIDYRATDMGLLKGELLKGSHSGSVRFMPQGDSGCSMKWEVEVEARHRASFWEAATRANIDYVSDNIVSYVDIPKLYRRWTRLASENLMGGVTAAEAADEWVKFCFYEGGGLPLPSPIRLPKQGLIVRIPPFLIERLILIDEDRNEIQYEVDNPALWNYQVHTHTGRVRFTDLPDGKVEMLWEVEVRPYNGWESVVQTLTSSVVTTMSRDFKAHLADPGAKVPLKLPRGKGDLIVEIPKSSWIGGVLDEQQKDHRSSREQLVDLFLPWTWGRTEDGEGEGEEWIQGYLS